MTSQGILDQFLNMIRGRFARKWMLLTLIMFCLIYSAVYLSTLHEFEVSVNLQKPRRDHPPSFPWEVQDFVPVEDVGEPQPKEEDGGIGGVPNDTDTKSAEDVKSQEKDEMPNETEDFMSVQASINERRREVIRKTCQQHPELSRGPITDNTYRHIYFDDKHKLLYCFIPKVGCSNWKRVMMILNGANKNISSISSDEVHFHNGMKRLAGLSPSERKKRLQTYTNFVYARNPFIRVLSAFKNKYGDAVQYRKETYFHQFAKTIMKKFRPNATPEELRTGENITWTEFVKFLTQQQRPFFDDHWEEMYKLCAPCKLNYHYVGHLETVEDDAKFMLKKLDLDSIVAYPSRGNSHPTNSIAAYESSFKELPGENLKRLWQIFSTDFNLFDYPKPDFIP